MCCLDFQPEPELPEGERGARLSWRLDDVNKAVGEKGCSGKFNMLMVAQLFLSIFYAITYGVTFQGTNAYYEWPINKIENQSLWQPYTNVVEVYLSAILEEEQSFGCGNRTFYRNETGPILNVSSEDIKIVYNNESTDMITLFRVCCYFMIFVFACVVVSSLYSGHYNQLLLIVSFEEGEDGKIEPKKLSFAWTIMCNAKTISNIVFKEVCGRLALYTVDENRAKNNGTEAEYAAEGTAALVPFYLLGWFFILIWSFRYFASCGNLCCTPESEARCGWRVFRFFVVWSVFVMYVIWFIDFDPPSEFNPETPWLCFTNGVALCDLAANTLYDIYDACSNSNMCGTNAVKGTEYVADAERGTETAPDTEEDLSSPEMAPPHQYYSPKW